jgi:hypothetical protein
MNNLTTEKLFAILIRMFVVGVLWNAIDIFTYFPSHWMTSDIAHSHPPTFWTSLDNLRLYLLYLRFALHVIVGMYLLAKPHALARRLAKELFPPDQT